MLSYQQIYDPIQQKLIALDSQKGKTVLKRYILKNGGGMRQPYTYLIKNKRREEAKSARKPEKAEFTEEERAFYNSKINEEDAEKLQYIENKKREDLAFKMGSSRDRSNTPLSDISNTASIRIAPHISKKFQDRHAQRLRNHILGEFIRLQEKRQKMGTSEKQMEKNVNRSITQSAKDGSMLATDQNDIDELENSVNTNFESWW